MAKISEDNEMAKDNVEAIFLECDENIIDKIVPKKELENFEIDIKEIMKSGCNRQIAEYSLMQYKNNTSKNEYSKYEKAKEELINEINTKLGNKIEAIINTENKDLVEKETYMFYNCKRLAGVYINYFDHFLVSNAREMFYNCISLGSFTFNPHFA